MEYRIYIGTYTHDLEDGTPTGSQGIYQFTFDPDTGKLVLQSVCGAKNPTFLALGKTHLYTSNETLKEGCVSAYRMRQNGVLQRDGMAVSADASSTCQIALDPLGRWLFGANYYSGNISICPLHPDGSIDGRTILRQHEGSSVHPLRQKEPHVHSVNPDPSGRFLIAADLGKDRLLAYRLAEDSPEVLIPNEAQAYAQVKPGEGPRHFAFHPNGRHAYLSTEIGHHIVVYDYDTEQCILTEKQMVSTLPEEYAGENHTAHVAISGSGRFVLVSNRGHNSLAVFRTDTQDGRLSPVGWTHAQGDWPRHMCFGPDDKTLIVASNISGHVTVFSFNPHTGEIGGLLWKERVPGATCAILTKGSPSFHSKRLPGGTHG